MATQPTLSVGDMAPDFSLAAHDGKTYCCASFWAGASCCTSIRGTTRRAAPSRRAIFAITARVFQNARAWREPDSVASHQRFSQNTRSPFRFCPMPARKWPSGMGRMAKRCCTAKTLGMIRSTFVIDESGRIAQVYGKVSVKGHVERVFADLGDALGSAHV